MEQWEKDLAALPDDDDWMPLVDLCKRLLCLTPDNRITAEDAKKVLDDLVRSDTNSFDS